MSCHDYADKLLLATPPTQCLHFIHLKVMADRRATVRYLWPWVRSRIRRRASGTTIHAASDFWMTSKSSRNLRRGLELFTLCAVSALRFSEGPTRPYVCFYKLTFFFFLWFLKMMGHPTSHRNLRVTSASLFLIIGLGLQEYFYLQIGNKH